MTKQEALTALKSTNQIDVHRRTPAWEAAFSLYNAANNSKLQPNCGSCFRKVRIWLMG
jgi:hypothetical protein